MLWCNINLKRIEFLHHGSGYFLWNWKGLTAAVYNINEVKHISDHQIWFAAFHSDTT